MFFWIGKQVWYAVLAVSMLLSGCASEPSTGGQPTSSSLQRTAPDSDHAYDVVDCLLPGQIRQLGANVTYLTERRPIRTTAEDCIIRGGEYVSADRADYATSLKVWMKTAQTGDPEAQYYVATLYEKGATGAPDYSQAAAWYRKAADQGFRRADIALGRLYEQGLGVAKDPGEAYKWFAKSSGLTDATLSLLVHQQATQQARALERTITEKEQEIGSLRKELDQVHQELAGLQTQIKDRQTQSTNQEAIIRQQEQQLKAVQTALEKAQAAPNFAGEVAGLRQQVETLSAEIARRQAEVNQRNQEITRLQGRIGSLEKTASRITILEQTVAVREREDQELRNKLAAEDQELRKLDAALKDRIRAFDGEHRQFQELNDRYQRAQAELEQLRAKPDQTLALKRQEEAVQALRLEIEQSRQKRTAQDREVARLHERITALERESEQRARELEVAAAVDLGLDGPTVEIIDPPLLRTRGVQVVSETLAMPVSSVPGRTFSGRVLAPAGLRSLLVNGLPVKANEAGVFTAPLPLPPSDQEEARVQILAIDIQNKKATLQFVVKPKGAVQVSPVSATQDLGHFGKYFALVIGNDHYQHWPELVNAIPDATAVASLLHKRYGFQVTLLKDATRQQILKALNEYRKTLTEKDNLLVYYAGHGHVEHGIDRGYWIPVDGEVSDNTHWILLPNVTDLLQLMAAKHVMIVADSCFGGKLTRNSLAQLRPGLSDQARASLLKTLAQKRVRTAMTSGGVRPVLDAGGKGHSVFAEALLEVLEENNTVLEAERLFWAVRHRVIEASQQLQVEQIPTYDPIHMAGHESLGDFIFVPQES
jgi:peptidoglycan hydrolase CwlO-like protein